MTTPTTCPRCASLVGHSIGDIGIQFKCGTIRLLTGHVAEALPCYMRQRDQLEKRVADLSECIASLHAILKEWQSDFPDCVGDNEPAAMAKAALLISKHEPLP